MLNSFLLKKCKICTYCRIVSYPVRLALDVQHQNPLLIQEKPILGAQRAIINIRNSDSMAAHSGAGRAKPQEI